MITNLHQTKANLLLVVSVVTGIQFCSVHISFQVWIVPLVCPWLWCNLPFPLRSMSLWRFVRIPSNKHRPNGPCSALFINFCDCFKVIQLVHEWSFSRKGLGWNCLLGWYFHSSMLIESLQYRTTANYTNVMCKCLQEVCSICVLHCLQQSNPFWTVRLFVHTCTMNQKYMLVHKS